MTVCVATICDEGKALVLAADKMVSIGFVEGELDNIKMMAIHPFWYMMIAGDDIGPLFEIVDLARAELAQSIDVSLEQVIEIVQRNYGLVRIRRAEALILKPVGWTIQGFNREGTALPNFLEMQSRVQSYELSVQILVAGFDPRLRPPAKIFTLDPSDKGIPRRHDIPGFASIGSGAVAAEYMMHFRDVSPKLPVRAAVYYTLEAKYFGEYASGVGLRTDMLVIYHDGVNLKMVEINDENTIEKKLVPMCERLEPSDPTADDVDILNNLPELKGLPPLSKRRRGRRGQVKRVT